MPFSMTVTCKSVIFWLFLLTSQFVSVSFVNVSQGMISYYCLINIIFALY